MPINIPNTLPASDSLKKENIFIINHDRAVAQDIRPLEILILNLMPTKIVTETQLLRLISNTPLQVNIELMCTVSHISKNTSKEHLLSFYKDFNQVKHRKFDGMIITGAPVEKMNFEDVDYWDELVDIMEWSKSNVHSTLHICWGAQAALFYHYGVGKHILDRKMFGVFKHKTNTLNHQLLRGLDDVFYIPHSRHTNINTQDVKNNSKLHILAESEISGIGIIEVENGKQFFALGHSEYDRDTLALEYERDINLNMPIHVPLNYYVNDNPQQGIQVLWKSSANILFSNWLNYYVYQSTPFNIQDIK